MNSSNHHSSSYVASVLGAQDARAPKPKNMMAANRMALKKQ